MDIVIESVKTTHIVTERLSHDQGVVSLDAVYECDGCNGAGCGRFEGQLTDLRGGVFEPANVSRSLSRTSGAATDTMTKRMMFSIFHVSQTRLKFAHLHIFLEIGANYVAILYQNQRHLNTGM